MQTVANFVPHKITIAPNKMKQRGQVAGKLPAALRLSEKEEAATSGAQRKGQAACGVTAKKEPGRKDGEQCHGEKIHPVHTGAFRLTLGPAGANLTSIRI